MLQLSTDTEAIPVSKGSVNHFSCHKPKPKADQAAFCANTMKVECTLMRMLHENCRFRARQRGFRHRMKEKM